MNTYKNVVTRIRDTIFMSIYFSRMEIVPVYILHAGAELSPLLFQFNNCHAVIAFSILSGTERSDTSVVLEMLP